jgi:hypothetical protein
MPTRRFGRKALAQLLVGGCAVACVMIEHAQAQPIINPPPAPPPPTFNPSSPNVVPQPSYTPSTRSTPSAPSTPSTVPSSEVTPPANEQPSSTTAQSEQPPVTKKRSVHHHRSRYIGVGPTLGSFYCPDGWCVRISPPYAYYRPYSWYRY